MGGGSTVFDAALEAVASIRSSGPPPLNRDQLLMLQEDNIGDGKPADDLFGLKPPGFLQSITEHLAGNQTSMP